MAVLGQAPGQRSRGSVPGAVGSGASSSGTDFLSTDARQGSQNRHAQHSFPVLSPSGVIPEPAAATGFSTLLAVAGSAGPRGGAVLQECFECHF